MKRSRFNLGAAPISHLTCHRQFLGLFNYLVIKTASIRMNLIAIVWLHPGLG
jgi:hypothetical protein